MINFKTPELSDRAAAANAVADSGYIGSDASFANIFLLRQKYGTQIALQDGFLFRYYNGVGSRRGYAFPLGSGEPQAALALIAEDARESGRPLEFCLVDEPRAQILREYFDANSFVETDGVFGKECAEPLLRFEENRGDSDYIYSAESLATLAGNQYKKKRNHVSRFNRTYSDYEIRALTSENFADALAVEKSWLNIETLGESSDTDCECTCECREAAWAERSEDEKSRLSEYCAIREALEHFDALGMKGAVLYIGGASAGMTMASEILPGVWDIHFEKVIDEYAENGGYAIINKLFAERLVAAGAKFINREEDINIEGLRKAKLSYYPQTILDKSHIVILEG
ncbi:MULTISPECIES: phosphatidylglycerol lysyltransferase domain-containing protein [unclassified Fibrobacter]|uniref:DUF2156 domain-containing protein n=1 Tax=unclassified Fibrobacter TaxID=2634177 RepID=UPI0025C13BD8|nr:MULTISPECIES: phosphatidylglycerol lysyltransferase domain-containing protein [unclassified Fibrobacter]